MNNIVLVLVSIKNCLFVKFTYLLYIYSDSNFIFVIFSWYILARPSAKLKFIDSLNFFMGLKLLLILLVFFEMDLLADT